MSRKKIPQLAAAGLLALALFAVPGAFAADKPTGTIVAVAEGVADVKGADGKIYKIKVEDIVAEDLKTGDMVEYELVEGQPVHAKKKAK